MVGYRYANRYQATDVIGQDEISVVRRGRDLLMDRDVAIRVLRADLPREPDMATSFRQVANHAAALNHPAFVAVYDTGDTPTDSGSLPFVVMEYVEGDTLRSVLGRQGPLPWRRALRIAGELCAALPHHAGQRADGPACRGGRDRPGQGDRHRSTATRRGRSRCHAVPLAGTAVPRIARQAQRPVHGRLCAVRDALWQNPLHRRDGGCDRRGAPS